MRVENFSEANFRSTAISESERVIHWLGHKAFLSWWAHPNPFRKTSPGAVPNKEICDLLVAFEDDVLVFSDKRCEWIEHPDPNISWLRWHKRAVEKSISQLRGAERFIRQDPGLLYQDPSCESVLSVDRDRLRKARIHKIAVVQGAEAAVRKAVGGPGTLMIESIGGTDPSPFTLGQVFDGSMYHVMDGVAARMTLTNLDTARDFVRYLNERERFFKSTSILVPGEDELLAIYLMNGSLPESVNGTRIEQVSSLVVPEGYAEDFQKSGKYGIWVEENEQSYILDEIIEKFKYHLDQGTSIKHEGFDPVEFEHGYRRIAATARVERRMLVAILASMALDPDHKNPGYMRRAMVRLQGHDDHALVLLVVDPGFARSEEEYREYRRNLLRGLMIIARKIIGQGSVVGLALNSAQRETTSEDFMLLKESDWSAEMEEEATQLQSALGIWKDENWVSSQYYALERSPEMPKPGVAAGIDEAEFAKWVAEGKEQSAGSPAKESDGGGK